LTHSSPDQHIISLDAIYASHPLNEHTLLARLERQAFRSLD